MYQVATIYGPEPYCNDCCDERDISTASLEPSNADQCARCRAHRDDETVECADCGSGLPRRFTRQWNTELVCDECHAERETLPTRPPHQWRRPVCRNERYGEEQADG